LAIDDKQLVALLTNFKDEIIQSVDHQMGIVQEDVQHKLDLVVEGQQALVKQLDRMEGRLEDLGTRVDGIAINLSAHRRDTEAHRKGWRVREDE